MSDEEIPQGPPSENSPVEGGRQIDLEKKVAFLSGAISQLFMQHFKDNLGDPKIRAAMNSFHADMARLFKEVFPPAEKNSFEMDSELGGFDPKVRPIHWNEKISRPEDEALRNQRGDKRPLTLPILLFLMGTIIGLGFVWKGPLIKKYHEIFPRIVAVPESYTDRFISSRDYYFLERDPKHQTRWGEYVHATLKDTGISPEAINEFLAEERFLMAEFAHKKWPISPEDEAEMRKREEAFIRNMSKVLGADWRVKSVMKLRADMI